MTTPIAIKSMSGRRKLILVHDAGQMQLLYPYQAQAVRFGNVPCRIVTLTLISKGRLHIEVMNGMSVSIY